MKFVKNSFVMFFMIMLFATVLTACGSKTDNNPSNATTDSSFDANERGEDEFPGKIKSEEELAALEEEARQYEEQGTEDNSEPEENPANVDMEGHEPESYGSGNFQDYWEGDDYFDLVGYLKDNGADKVYATSKYSYPVEDNSNIDLYVASFYNEQWEVTIMTDAGITLGHAYCDDSGKLCKDPHYIISCPTNELGQSIRIDSAGTTTGSGIISILDTVIQCMKNNRDSNNPLENSNLQYISQPLS